MVLKFDLMRAPFVELMIWELVNFIEGLVEMKGEEEMRGGDNVRGHW